MRFLADENFDNDILRGVWRRVPTAIIHRVQDLIPEAEDPIVLEYAAEHGYVLLTHDVNTMRGFYYERLEAQLPVPGVFLVHKKESKGAIVDSLELILLASQPEEWAGKITFLPLR